MHWEVLIVPLIALGVWILGTLFRPEEDERAKQRRRGPLEGGARLPPRRPVTDLDRFLEEARRRRETAERGRSASPPAETAPEPQQRVARPPLLQDRPSREPPRRPRPAPSTPSRRPAAEVPVALPVARPVTIPVPEPSIPTAVVVPIAEPIPPPADAAEVSPAGVHPDAPHKRSPVLTPVLAQVAALLRSPQSAGAALVLREIFDQPLCRRRR
jgi:hypothetical protein